MSFFFVCFSLQHSLDHCQVPVTAANRRAQQFRRPGALFHRAAHRQRGHPGNEGEHPRRAPRRRVLPFILERITLGRCLAPSLRGWLMKISPLTRCKTEWKEFWMPDFLSLLTSRNEKVWHSQISSMNVSHLCHR